MSEERHTDVFGENVRVPFSCKISIIKGKRDNSSVFVLVLVLIFSGFGLRIFGAVVKKFAINSAIILTIKLSITSSSIFSL
jgi:hypothetical protein